MPTVTALYTYPIKSCGGLSHETLKLEATGPVYDRHWMLTEDDGMFMTQREVPRMALIQPHFDGEDLVVTAPGMEPLRIPLVPKKALPCQRVTIWRDTVEAANEGAYVADWFSEFLKMDVSMFRLPPTSVREVDATYNTGDSAHVSFADGYPMLLIGEESLADLNRRLVERGHHALEMRNFRPNIVIGETGKPYAEDDWSRITVNDLPFDLVKPCARCAITTVDPETGEVPNPKEPLATLATYRKGANGVLFGQNVIHRAQGTLSVGDSVTVA